MADQAQVVVARKANDCHDNDPWIGAGRALAGEIWGINYAGTISPHGIPTAGGSCLSAGCFEPNQSWITDEFGKTTAPVWSAGMRSCYGQAAPQAPSQIGIVVWGGEYVVSVPTRLAPPAPESALWSREGVGASSIVFVCGSQLTSTDPSDSAHTPAWRQLFQYSQLPQDTAVGGSDALLSRDPHSELRSLAETTRLSVEQLGGVVGGSRRSVYNWLAGRPIGDEARARIFRLRDTLDPITSSRDSALVRDWLVDGDPSALQLATTGHWDELQSRVEEATSPHFAAKESLGGETENAPAESAGVIQAALLAFATPVERPTVQRPYWKPREITGMVDEGEEEPE